MNFDKARTFGIRSDLIKTFGSVIHQDWKAKLGLTIIGVLAIAAIFAPELAPYDPMAQEHLPFQPPLSDGHLLGTDSYGRDMLSRIMHGARISLLVGIGAVATGALVGLPLGLLGGYFGGRVDDVAMRIVDTFWAFPWLVVAILLVTIVGRGVTTVILALGFAYVDDFARIVRGEVLALREEEFTLAAQSIGMSDIKIILEEIFPNAIAPVIVQFTLLVAWAMLAEATLSFLGIGVEASTPTWGNTLGQGRTFITQAWWISVIPGLMITLSVLGINLFGDSLRDAFDVRTEGQ